MSKGPCIQVKSRITFDEIIILASQKIIQFSEKYNCE